MTAKEFLSRGIFIERRVKQKWEQIQRLRELQTNVSSVLYSHAKSRRSGANDKLGDITADLFELADEYRDEAAKLLSVKREIKRAIGRVLRDDYRLLLALRYESFLTWERLAVEMGLSWTAVHKKHRNALRCIEAHTIDVV